MNSTLRYLEAVKEKTGAPSDYALAKVLNVTRQQVSLYKTKGQFIGGDVALRVADILEIDPVIVLSDIQADKAKTDDERAVWRSLIERIGGVAATLLIATGISAANPSPANAGAASSVSDGSGSMYIMLNRRKKPRKTKRKIDLSFLVGNMLQTA